MEEANALFAAEGIAPEQTMFRFIADMRYMGQEHTVQVAAPAYPWKEEDRSEILTASTRPTSTSIPSPCRIPRRRSSISTWSPTASWQSPRSRRYPLRRGTLPAP